MWSNLRFIGGGLDVCQCYSDGETVYRAVPRSGFTDQFLQSKQYHKLVNDGLIIHTERTDIDPANFPIRGNNNPKNRVIYKSPFIPFALYSDTPGLFWTKAHMIEFLRSYAQLNKTLKGCLCVEPVEGNFAFVGSKPTLVDIGSISPRHELIGPAKKNLLRELSGFGLDKKIKDLKFVKDDIWDQILSIIDSMSDVEEHNQWDDYNKRSLPIPGEVHEDDKEMIWMRSIISKLEIKTILDVGGNDGYFSFALENENLRICCIDNAKNAIIKGFKHAKKHNSKTVFYEVNVVKEYKPHIRRITKEEVHWQSKLEADCVVASSVMHHLCNQNKSLQWQNNLYKKLARKYLLFEYIDKQDPHVKNWPQTWSKDQFHKLIEKDWRIVGTLEDYARDKNSRPYRKWYALERVQPNTFLMGVPQSIE